MLSFREKLDSLYDQLDFKKNKIEDVVLNVPDVFRELGLMNSNLYKEIRAFKKEQDRIREEVFKKYRTKFDREYSKTEIEDVYLLSNKEYSDLQYKKEKYEVMVQEIEKFYGLLNSINFLVSNFLKIKENK